MGRNSNRNRKVAQEAERYLKDTPEDLLGPAGRILVSNPPVLTKRRVAATLRTIDGQRTTREPESQPPLLGPVRSD